MSIVLVSLPFFPQTSHANRIDLPSLLEEMITRRQIAEFPEPAFVCKQASSYNRHSVTPDRPDWFTGGDFDQFYGCDLVEGRKEWIMLDVAGPGVVTRWWQTQYRGVGTIRIYLDRAKEPIFKGTGDELVAGDAITGPPLAANRGGGRNLYLPIPFPSHFGTGSEDYFGYAFNHTRPFEAPFHAQPIAQGNWGIGHTTNVRGRVHDRIPFKTRFKFDMELFHWQPKRKTDYATTTHWYAFDGASCNGLRSAAVVQEKVGALLTDTEGRVEESNQ